MVLDEVLHPAAPAVGGLIEERWPGVFEAGNDEADVVTQCGNFCHHNHPEFTVPGAGLIPYLPEHAGFFAGLLVFAARRSQCRLGERLEDGIGCESEDILDTMSVAPPA